MNIADFDPVLIERYGGRGPRYTSYPTAVQFRPDFREADYRSETLRANQTAPTRPLSAYIHIPFCESLCYYCGCSKIVTRHRDRAADYLKLLLREIALQGQLFPKQRPVEQVHLGGGTPTYLSREQMHSLMDSLSRGFSLRRDDHREFSIEVDPRTVTPEDVAFLRECGFNRISMGVQDFDPDVQRAVNRLQPPETTAELIHAARDSGFRSVSLDLIYGLPLQTVGRFDQTLSQVIAMRPDRLAIYSYAHLPQLFRAQRLIREDQLPSPTERLEILKTAIQRLTVAGYIHIGMDHFALADDELVKARERGELQRNFQGYSTHGEAELIGLGLTAIGQVGHCYAQNAKAMTDYRTSIEQGKLPVSRGLLMTADDWIRRHVIQQIMCQGKLQFDEVSKGFGIDFRAYFEEELRRLRALEADGLIEIANDDITVTERGCWLLRAVAMIFDRYLTAPGVQQTFSKVI